MKGINKKLKQSEKKKKYAAYLCPFFSLGKEKHTRRSKQVFVTNKVYLILRVHSGGRFPERATQRFSFAPAGLSN